MGSLNHARLFGLSVSLVVAIVIGAQEPTGHEEPVLGAPEFHSYALLNVPHFQRELAMSKEQIIEAAKLAEQTSREWLAVFSATRNLKTEERDAKRSESYKAIDKRWRSRIIKVLSQEQVRRYRQIDLQRRGLFACEEKETADALALTSAQRESIEMLIREYRVELQKQFDDGVRPKPGEADTIRDTALAKIDATLTESQRDTWTRMLGARFDESALK